MRSLFATDVFNGFGPTQLHPADYEIPLGEVRHRKTAQLRQGIRESAPRHPGVYGMLDARGHLIYVGKAKLLRARLMSYFRSRSRDPKAGRIIGHTRAIVWEETPNEFAALVRELELIRRHRPRFNVQGQPGYRRYSYICLGRAPAPYAFVTREPTGKDSAWFGPLRGAARARDAARRINDFFRLRDCSQRQRMCFADQRELFDIERNAGCLRFEIATCSGPCAGRCSRGQYGAQVRAARGFLDGRDAAPLQKIREAMEQAAAACEFERAAGLRDRLNDLEWLNERLAWLRAARDQHSFVYPLAGPDERTIWYLIHRGQVRAAVYEPTTARTRTLAAALIEQVFCKAGPLYSRPVAEGLVDSVLLVSGWFRKFPEQRAGLMLYADAIKRLTA